MSDFITLQIAKGHAFFLGLAVVIIALCWRLVMDAGLWRVWTRLLVLVGAVLVAVSATPLPAWIYVLWFSLLVIALVLQRSRFSWVVECGPAVLLLGLSLALCLYELTWRGSPTIQMRSGQTIYILGDSLSALAAQQTQPWPEVMQDKYGIQVVNLAVPGATADSAFPQLKQVQRSNSVVILEIGGNDLLRGASSSDFAVALERLISPLSGQGHTLVMFELPLFPFCNGYGCSQRHLAQKYHVSLFPKTYLANVIGARGGTLDGLHLSPRGHEALATLVGRRLRIERKAGATSGAAETH